MRTGLVALMMLALACCGGLAAQTPIQLTTTFSSNNGLTVGGNFFDVTTTSAPIEIVRFDCNTDGTAATTWEIYYKTGTYVGSETNAGAWTLHETIVATGAGTDNPTNLTLTTPLTVPGASTYGFFVFLSTSAGINYTGTGTTLSPNQYSDSNIVISVGASLGAAFTGSVINARAWNGTIYYNLITTNGTYSSNVNVPGLVVGAGAASTPAFSFQTYAAGINQDLNSVTVNKSGTLADAEISAVKLWRDTNANGRVDTGEPQLGSNQTFSGGAATFTGSPLATLTAATNTRFLVTIDVSGSATVGSTVSLAISGSSSLSFNPGPDNSTNYPYTGSTFTVVQVASSLPWLENFDGATLQGNVQVRSGAGNYPTGTAVGAVPTSVSQTGIAQFTRDAGAPASAAPLSAPNAGHWTFNTVTTAALALDMYFDLSAFTSADSLDLVFSWQDTGMDTTAGTSGVFLSDDGGLTWKIMAYRFSWAVTPENTWREERIALTPFVQSANMAYTSTFVVRLQIAEPGITTAPFDNALIENLRLERPVELTVGGAVATYHAGGAAGDTNVVVGSLAAFGKNATHNISDVTLTRTGTLPDSDITAVRLWRDANASGTFDGADTQVGSSQTFSGGTAVFSGSPLAAVNLGQTELYFVTLDLAGTATAGSTFGVQIASAGAINVSPGPVAGTFPISSVLHRVIVRDATLPTAATAWVENFDGAGLLANTNLVASAGVYPGATTAGGTITPEFVTRSGTWQVIGTYSGVTANSAPNMLTYDPGISTTGVPAACAVDFHFDLSRFNVSQHSVEFEFRYWADGIDTTANRFSAAFLSTDGGLTWDRCLFKLPTTSSTAWNLFNANLTSALLAVSKNFTNKVVLRIQVADDLAGAASGDLLHIDDVSLFLSPQMLVQAPVATTVPDVVASGATDVVVLAMSLTAINTAQDVTNLTLTRLGLGSDSDFNQVRLFEDTNASGDLDASDTQIGTAQTVSGGVVSFTGTPLYTVAQGATETIFVVVDIAASAQGGPNYAFALTNAAGLTVTPGGLSGTFPTTGPQFSIVVPTASLPYLCDFDSSVGNLALRKDPGQYPTATVLNQVPGLTASANRANPIIAGTQGTAAPISGANMGTMTWNNVSQAAGAMDFHFDLSSRSQSDVLIFSFSYYDNGLDTSVTLNDPFNWVFISTDGGATWLRNVLLLDNNIAAGWVNLSFNLTNSVYGVGSTFTNNVVVRLQLADNDDADFGHFEDVRLDMLQDIQLSRGATVLQNNGTDVAGSSLAGSPVQLTYEIENVAVSGAPDLSLTGTPVVQFTSVSNCSVTLVAAPTLNPIPATQSTNFTVEVTPTAGGVFLFTLLVPSNDPDEPVHAIVVFGTGTEPEIDVQRPAGTSIPSGSTDNIGSTAAGTNTTFTYFIVNGGTAQLSLTATPMVQVQAVMNCTATVTQQPTAGTLAAPGVAPFVVEVNPQLGAFSYTLVIPNDDLNEPNYTINVSGNGTTSPEIDIERVTGTSIPEGSVDNLGTSNPGTLATFTYTILNTGNAQLDLTGVPPVQVTGAFNCTVVVTAQPAMTAVPAGNSTTFTMEVTATAVGSYGFLVTVLNNDPTESNYQFTVSGFATNPPTNTGGSSDDGGGGCVAESNGSTWLVLIGLLAALALGLRFRRSL